VKRRGSQILYIIGSQVAVRLSVLRAVLPLPPGIFLVLISVRGCVDPRAMSVKYVVIRRKLRLYKILVAVAYFNVKFCGCTWRER
jgi:hypothetical protein